MRVKILPSEIKGDFFAPPSKSMMQRACALGLLNRGITTILNPGYSNDDLAALSIIESLGARVKKYNDSIVIISDGKVNPHPDIFCGESGLSFRLFSIVAAIGSNEFTITGTGSLLSRGMDTLIEMLNSLEVKVSSNDGRLPFKINSPIVPKNISVDGSKSSQYLTGLLMALGSSAEEPVTIEVENLVSKPYIDLTLDMMRFFGYEITHEAYQHFHIKPKQKVEKNIDLAIEGDWSSASFFLIAGAIQGGINVSGLNINSTQADRMILDVLNQVGVNYSISNKQIQFSKTNDLKSFAFDATDCPDLFPPLVVLALHCNGTSSIKGVHRLLNKESNRAFTLQTVFSKMGAQIDIVDDEMIVQGNAVLIGAEVESHHDHRIAMALSIAALSAKGETSIVDAEAVHKSFPEFYDKLKLLGCSLSLIK
jgi:3-phosphoshikimate 1-carboxyvinyltransferase